MEGGANPEAAPGEAPEPPPGEAVEMSKNQRKRLARMKRKERPWQDPELPHIKSLGVPVRYEMHISFNGTAFHGWQRQCPKDQEPLRTVQGVLEDSARKALQQRLRIFPSGRTDSGCELLNIIIWYYYTC